jgi:hypothetical protein
MPFHVEISSGFRQRARAFNLDEQALRETIIEPWLGDRIIELGDKRWQPRDCKLMVLEGPELADTDLSMGRGWSNAERSSTNVTRKLVEEEAPATAGGPVVAVLAESEAAAAELAALLGRLELETAPWAELRGRILGTATAEGGPGYAAVLAVESSSPGASWLFDAGLARGALGARAVVAQLGDSGIPAQLTGIDVMRVDPGDDASARALRKRLAG